MIKRHRAELLYEDSHKAHRITVRRGHIMDDALVAIRSGFDEKKHIRVRFLGEPAVDEGGPGREFFMLLMGAIANNSSLLDGPPNCRVLRHNTSAFQVQHIHISLYYAHDTCTYHTCTRAQSCVMSQVLSN